MEIKNKEFKGETDYKYEFINPKGNVAKGSDFDMS